MGDGVWYLIGGSHHSLVVEFNDYIAIIEAPLSEERSMAVIAEAKKLVPNKPIKYLLMTHHHFDHTGGLRTYAAEGVTIVTNQSNVALLREDADGARHDDAGHAGQEPDEAELQPVSRTSTC